MPRLSRIHIHEQRSYEEDFSQDTGRRWKNRGAKALNEKFHKEKLATLTR